MDLGATQRSARSTLNWEAAYAKAFQIQTSDDGTNWTTIKTVTGGTGGIQTLDVTGSGRYVRMYGTARGTGYGYSLWEFAVYTGTDGLDPTTPRRAALDAADPPARSRAAATSARTSSSSTRRMSTASIQSQLDEIFAQQERASSAPGAHAFLFKPGTYNGLNAQVGFYTSIKGLGQNPRRRHHQR